MDLSEKWSVFLSTRDRKVRSELILNYVSLVKYVADHLVLSVSGALPKEDIISAGIVGLISAIERFDASKGVKFETYAITRIKGSIIDEARRLDWVPRSRRRIFREIQQAYESIEYEKGQPATDEEVAKKVGISVDELNKALKRADTFSIMSLEQVVNPSGGDKAYRIIDIYKGDEKYEPQNIVDKKALVSILMESISLLSEQERTILALYYYEGLTLTEISEIIELSISRISQIHAKAILKLKSRIMKELDTERKFGEAKNGTR